MIITEFDEVLSYFVKVIEHVAANYRTTKLYISYGDSPRTISWIEPNVLSVLFETYPNNSDPVGYQIKRGTQLQVNVESETITVTGELLEKSLYITIADSGNPINVEQFT